MLPHFLLSHSEFSLLWLMNTCKPSSDAITPLICDARFISEFILNSSEALYSFCTGYSFLSGKCTSNRGVLNFCISAIGCCTMSLVFDRRFYKDANIINKNIRYDLTVWQNPVLDSVRKRVFKYHSGLLLFVCWVWMVLAKTCRLFGSASLCKTSFTLFHFCYCNITETQGRWLN